jgi:anti-sigma factor RsiW
MSSIANPQFESPDDEQLVAYLDGELSPEECRAVEDRLAKDDTFRQQLHDLDTAWEALSSLPPATVDDSFARTTIELACVQAEQDLSQQ